MLHVNMLVNYRRRYSMLFESSKFSFFLVTHLLAVVETNLKKTRRLNALNNTDKDNTSLPINIELILLQRTLCKDNSSN